MYQRRQFAKKSAKRRGGNKQHSMCSQCWKSAMDSKRAQELKESKQEEYVATTDETNTPELSRAA